MKAALFIASIFLSACAPQHTPEEALRIAMTYSELGWQPRAWHIRHGKDGKGIIVHTPDTTLAAHTGDLRGWWEPGVPAKGMPYKWGGFDTPESFLQGLSEGKKAGDIANTYKVNGDNAVISSESVGIDCSGFVSRCWGLSRHYDTRDLPGICDPISWEELRPADIILKNGHVLLFSARQGDYVIGYEAGPKPTWRARCGAILISYLKKEGYTPLRYRHMSKPTASAPKIEYDISHPTELNHFGDSTEDQSE